mmetsp:Transcript_39591/g.157194  ORF Transcript_39591/g.157194 Transcript_39591/m.157194 type:complete len:100 (-) Transcript_39591:5145-5444(-)
MAILSEHVRKSLIRVIPGAFVFGAAIEWFMINVSVGQETFCKYNLHEFVHVFISLRCCDWTENLNSLCAHDLGRRCGHEKANREDARGRLPSRRGRRKN